MTARDEATRGGAPRAAPGATAAPATACDVDMPAPVAAAEHPDPKRRPTPARPATRRDPGTGLGPSIAGVPPPPVPLALYGGVWGAVVLSAATAAASRGSSGAGGAGSGTAR